MSPADVARRIVGPCSPDAVARMAQKGQIPGAVKIRKRWELPPSAVALVAQRLAAREGAREGRG